MSAKAAKATKTSAKVKAKASAKTSAKASAKGKGKAKAKVASGSNGSNKRKRDEESEDESEDDDSENEDSGNSNDDDDDDDDDAQGSGDEATKSSPTKKKVPAAKSKAKSKAADAKSAKASKSKKSADKKSKKSSKSSDGKVVVGKVKTLNKLERLEEARKAFKWWETEPLPEGINWRTMEHPGVVFAPAYQPHGYPLLYKGKEIKLNSEQEELASFFAAIPDDGPQLGNPATREVFIKNFFVGFKEAFSADSEVKKFEDCDFTRIKAHLDLKKTLAKAATGEEKEAKKSVKDQVMLQYAYGLIDGRLEKVRCFILLIIWSVNRISSSLETITLSRQVCSGAEVSTQRQDV
jgi:hypothetical protein